MPVLVLDVFAPATGADLFRCDAHSTGTGQGQGQAQPHPQGVPAGLTGPEVEEIMLSEAEVERMLASGAFEPFRGPARRLL